MKKEDIIKLHARFESIVRTVEKTGMEFWLARDLQEVLGYSRWENFFKVIEKAITASENSGCEASDHFREVTKMVQIGSGTEREVDDIALTRYACYLIAQNGDAKKTEIAFAQTYFAVQTRKQEIIVKRIAEEERLSARKKLSFSEKELSGIIFERVKDEKSFARIRSKGDKALFGGYSTQEMKIKLKVAKGRALADFLPTITIKAKDFANEITNFNIKKDNLDTETAITKEHVRNNQDVRKLLTDRNIKPEELPPAEDIKKVERRVKKDTKFRGSTDKLIISENEKGKNNE
jgi:DNA-damage-inducible protein D